MRGRLRIGREGSTLIVSIDIDGVSVRWGMMVSMSGEDEDEDKQRAREPEPLITLVEDGWICSSQCKVRDSWLQRAQATHKPSRPWVNPGGLAVRDQGNE